MEAVDAAEALLRRADELLERAPRRRAGGAA